MLLEPQHKCTYRESLLFLPVNVSLCTTKSFCCILTVLGKNSTQVYANWLEGFGSFCPPETKLCSSQTLVLLSSMETSREHVMMKSVKSAAREPAKTSERVSNWAASPAGFRTTDSSKYIKRHFPRSQCTRRDMTGLYQCTHTASFINHSCLAWLRLRPMNLPHHRTLIPSQTSRFRDTGNSYWASDCPCTLLLTATLCLCSMRQWLRLHFSITKHRYTCFLKFKIVGWLKI